MNGRPYPPLQGVCIMRRAWVMICILFLLDTGNLALALRCQGRIVSLGDHALRVRNVCGEPTHIEIFQEVLPVLRYDPHCFFVHHPFCAHTIYLTTEVWTYDFGPGRLVYFLTFRQGKLVHMETGGYGTPPPPRKPEQGRELYPSHSPADPKSLPPS